MKNCFLFFALMVIDLSFASDSHYLIQEMELLRDSLKIDDPARMDLTLRLADLYFDVSIQEGKSEDQDELKKSRMKALDLYKYSLDNTKGLDRIKIHFQIGRLLTRLDEKKMAESYFLQVFNAQETPHKMKEQSALSLAEWYEEDVQYGPAEKYYQQVIALCDSTNGCNYAFYRLAWLFYKDNQLDNAIATMQKSLWGDQDVIRENSLTDLMLFMSNNETDGVAEFQLIQKISERANRPELLRHLVEAFYVAGNRSAGLFLLSELNKTDPNLYYEVRLLEEYYGFRKWDKVDHYLTIVEKRTAADIPSKAVEAKEILEILRRFIVQVDSEAQVAPDLKKYLKRSIDSYLGLYPNDELRKKMQQGWLDSEEDERARFVRLERWIKEDIALNVASEEVRKLRQTRLSLAQKLNEPEAVIVEANAIAEMLKGSPEADEFYYVAAREHYAAKRFDLAYPYFAAIVTGVTKGKDPSKWAILSQNLILDIYNHQKNFDGLITQIENWRNLTADSKSDEVVKENKSMEKIYLEAKFEQAATLGTGVLPLERFYQFCFEGIFPEKSCANAKVLAVNLKDQHKLIALLEREGDEKALMAEYELMGRYADAARLQEKLVLKTAKSLEPYLKLALLYELAQDNSNRDRVLANLVDKLKKEKFIPTELEGAIAATLEDAGLLNTSGLNLPWGRDMKLRIASKLELSQSTQETQRLLLQQKVSQGPVWSRLVLKQVQAEFLKASAIQFYGVRSKALFAKRTKAINQFVNFAKSYLDGADLETRIYILKMLAATYERMSIDIVSTPMPPDLDAETLKTVEEQLQAMSAPFTAVQLDYEKLLEEQLAAVAIERQVQLRANLAIDEDEAEFANFISLPEQKNQKSMAAISPQQLSNLISKLSYNPEDKETLSTLQDLYSKHQSERLSNYYAGRLESLGEVKQ